MTPCTFPDDGRRVVFYLIYDARGNIDDYIPYKLQRLRPHADTIIAVVNGSLTDQGRAALEPVVDEVWQRENVGFDVGGYREALDRFGQDRLADYDELILMNYTWFGPVRPFEPLFERMNGTDAHFWGLTDHGPVTPNPHTGRGTMPDHIQSHWIAVRRPMFTSAEWVEYWRTMPAIESYDDSIIHHETRFTGWFEERGHPHVVAFPYQEYAPSLHPAFLNARSLIQQGCPALKRRPFFHDPLYLDREGIVGRWLLQTATEDGYPEDLIWESMARTSEARVLYTNASLMEILPSTGSNWDPDHPLATAVVMHVYYEDMIEELLDAAETLPGPVDLYVTTSDHEKSDLISSAIRAREDRFGGSEVRVVDSNRGRDQSAFWVTCRDVLHDERYELVVKLHSKRSAQDGEGLGELFKRQQLENLFDTPDYVENIIGLFQRHRYLGMVFPPMIHIGYPTMGNAWFTNRAPARRLASELGIRVSLDHGSPLAPLGGMFIARRRALAKMAAGTWSFEDYAAEGDYGDGTLSHVQERLVAYAAAEEGYHSRTVATADYASISHTFLEYKLDQMALKIPGNSLEQVGLAHRLGPLLGRRSRLAFLKYYIALHHPRLTRLLLRLRGPRRVDDQ